MSETSKIDYYRKSLFEGTWESQVIEVGKLEKELVLHDKPEYADLLEKIFRNSIDEVVVATMRLIAYVNDLDRQASLLEIVLLRQDIEIIRPFVVVHLGKMRRIRSVDALVSALRTDPQPDIRMNAACAVSVHKNLEVDQKLIDSLPFQTSDKVIAMILISLGKRKTKNVVNQVNKYLYTLSKEREDLDVIMTVAHQEFGRKVLPASYRHDQEFEAMMLEDAVAN